MWAYEKLSFSQWYCYTAGLVSHSVVIMIETVEYWKNMNSAMNKKFPLNVNRNITPLIVKRSKALRLGYGLQHLNVIESNLRCQT